MACPTEVWKAILSFLDIMGQCRLLVLARTAVPDDIQSNIMQHYRSLFRARTCDMGIMSDVTAEANQQIAKLLLTVRAGHRLHRHVAQPLLRLSGLTLEFPGIDGDCSTSVRIVGQGRLLALEADCLAWAGRGTFMEKRSLANHLFYDYHKVDNVICSWEHLNDRVAVVMAAGRVLRHSALTYSLHAPRGTLYPSAALLWFSVFGMHGVVVNPSGGEPSWSDAKVHRSNKHLTSLASIHIMQRSWAELTLEDPDTLVEEVGPWQPRPMLCDRVCPAAPTLGPQDAPSDPPLLELTPSLASVQAILPSATHPATIGACNRVCPAAPILGPQDAPSDPPLLELTPSLASVQAILPSGTHPATIGAFADSARPGLPRWLRVETNNFMGWLLELAALGRYQTQQLRVQLRDWQARLQWQCWMYRLEWTEAFLLYGLEVQVD
eukprot:symbB.v1.2.038198.t1/scaffold5790.1/size33900/2